MLQITVLFVEQNEQNQSCLI